MAVENPKILKEACKLYPGKIAVAIDARKQFLAIKGWVKQTQIKLLDILKKLKNYGVAKIIYTDINRDGTKKGVNIGQLRKIIKITKIPIIASGGVSNILDIRNLLNLTALEGVIIGKAIYDKSIDLKKLKNLVLKD
jgi:phosphoribosylformimino-5-aminoimidazole carboxamide ribotide isomerase